MAGGECYKGKTDCPFNTRCRWHKSDLDGDPIQEKRCLHKPLFPMNSMDYATLVLMVIATALAAGGGIGGGGLLVPIYSIVGGFPTTQATALSLATISGGSIANLWTYTQRYHPNPALRRPLIDYDASLLFCPALLAGTMFGSMFSVMFPPVLVVICLVVLLGYSGKRTVKKGLAKWKAQNDAAAAKAASLAGDQSEVELVEKAAPGDGDEPLALDDVPLEDGGGRGEGAKGSAVAGVDGFDAEQADHNPLRPPLTDVQSIRLDTIRRADASLTPWSKWGYTLVLWVIVLVFALMRGGRGGASIIDPNLDCKDGLYWGLFGLNLLILLGATHVLRNRTLATALEKSSLGHVPLEGDLAWDERTTAIYPAICVFAGVAAGLLGIGGGMVLGPLLVELGCLPQPIAATSAYVVFITATSGLVQVYVMGLVPEDYAVIFACFGVISTFLGQTVVDWVVKKYKKDAIVILVIGMIMLIALVLMTYDGIKQIIFAPDQGFNALC